MDSNGYNASLLHTEPTKCYICGRNGDYGDMARHEIFYGNNRRMSKAMGTWVYLCPSCHQNAPYAVHKLPNEGIDLTLKKDGQRAFESVFSHGRFMEIFGKNYL